MLRSLFLALAAVVVFIEEVGWRPLAAALGRLSRWGPLRRLEQRVRRLPKRTALVVFGVPAVLLFPVKVVALGLMHAGHAVMGVTVIVLAKLVGTAVVGRLFVLLEPTLREYHALAVAFDWWSALKAQVKAWYRGTRVARRIAALRERLRRWRQRHAPDRARPATRIEPPADR